MNALSPDVVAIGGGVTGDLGGFVAAIGAGAFALLAIRRGDRSVLVFLSLVVGFVVVVFVLGELIGHE